jgi:hypothetical protein
MLANSETGSKSNSDDTRAQIDAGLRILRCFQLLHDYCLLCEKTPPMRMEHVARLVDEFEKKPKPVTARQRSRALAGPRRSLLSSGLAEAVYEVQELDVESLGRFALLSRHRFASGPIQGRSAVEALKTAIDGIGAPARSMKSRSETRYLRLFSVALHLSDLGDFDDRSAAVEAAAREVRLLETAVSPRSSDAGFSPRPKHIAALRKLSKAGAVSSSTATKAATLEGMGKVSAGGRFRETLDELRDADWLGAEKGPNGGYWLLHPAIEWLRANP